MLRHLPLAALLLVPAHAWADAPGVGPEIPGLASMLAGLPAGQAAGRDLLVHQVMHEAELQGVPPALADAVAVVETGYNPGAVGSSGEIGLMQIMPATAAMLGFHGTTQALFEPATNIHLSVAYLARAWAMSGGNVCRTLMKYRAGWGEEIMTPLSIRYCQRAHAWLATIGSPLATGPGAVLPMPPLADDPFVIHIAPTRVPPPPGPAPLRLWATAGWHPPPAGYRYHRAEAREIDAIEARFHAHQRHF